MTQTPGLKLSRFRTLADVFARLGDVPPGFTLEVRELFAPRASKPTKKKAKK